MTDGSSIQFSADPNSKLSMDVKLPKSRSRHLWTAAIGLVGFLGVASLVILARNGLDGTLQVSAGSIRIAQVTSQQFEETLPVRATVAPAASVYIDVPETGQVTQVLSRDGDLVGPGQVIAVLSNHDIESQVVSGEAEIAGRMADILEQKERLRADLMQSQQRVLEADFDLRRAQREAGIRQRLHSEGFVSEAGLRAALDDSAYSARRAEELHSSLRSLRVGVARQEAELADTSGWLREARVAVRGARTALTIRAPDSGQLTAFDLRIGQIIKRGERIGQIDDLANIILVAAIDEFYLSRITVGQAAVTKGSQQGRVVRVRRVLPQVKDGRFRIELEFESAPSEALSRGQNIDLQISLSEKRQALVLPRGQWLDDTGGNWAFVIGPDKTAERRAVKIGRRSNSSVEITSGLAQGDRVIVSSYKLFGDARRLSMRDNK